MRVGMPLLFAVLALCASVRAQSTISPPPPLPIIPQVPIFPNIGEELPPLLLTPLIESQELPNGMPVSRPLQAIQVTEPPTETIVREFATHNTPQTVVRSYSTTWYDFDTLLFWSKGQQLPPLAIGSRAGNSQLLLGGSQPSIFDVGGQFKYGFTNDKARAFGFEASYLFFNARKQHDPIGRGIQSRWDTLARPTMDNDEGIAGRMTYGSPNMVGNLDAILSTRLRAWEVLGLWNFAQGLRFRISGEAGYRYFNLSETVQLDQVTISTGSAPFPQTLLVTDRFDTNTSFHGGQLGLRAQWDEGPFGLEFNGKIAMGASVQSAHLRGQSVSLPHLPWYAPSASDSGVLITPMNRNRTDRNALAWLPEAGMKLKYRSGERMLFTMGYRFIYLSAVVRASDQILVGQPIPTGFRYADDRPHFPLIPSDYWLQGLTLGLELRY